MEVETPAPLTVAPPTPAVPEETENVETNQQQPVDEQLFATSPLNNSGQMLPPGTPAHISNEQINNENQVIIIKMTILNYCVIQKLKTLFNIKCIN